MGPGESSESPRMAGEVVEGVDLSRWRKRKGKEEMAGQSPGLSLQVKGGREGTTAWRGDWTAGNYHGTTVCEGTRRPQPPQEYFILKICVTPAM